MTASIPHNDPFFIHESTRIVPVHLDDRPLLGMLWQDCLYRRCATVWPSHRPKAIQRDCRRTGDVDRSALGSGVPVALSGRFHYNWLPKLG